MFPKVTQILIMTQGEFGHLLLCPQNLVLLRYYMKLKLLVVGLLLHLVEDSGAAQKKRLSSGGLRIEYGLVKTELERLERKHF